MLTLQSEVDANYDFFRRNLASFLVDHRDEYALLRHRSVVAFYPRLALAYEAALKQFSDDMFSIQHVTDVPIELGMMSLAVD